MAGMDRGYDYIAMTDHSKGLKIAGGMDEETLATQMQEIDLVNSQIEAQGHDFRVLRSIELNFDTAGAGDMDPEALAALDVVVGSFHSKLRLKDDQTARVLGAVRNPDAQIVGHPHGRMYGVRLGVQADWARAFEEGAAYGKAFEINAQANRQDLNVPMLELARETGVKLTIGTDAHSVEEMDSIDLSLAAAVKARVPRDQILNFLPLEEFLEWVTTSRATAARQLSRPTKG
ncbi:MAG: putative hydrolase, partial [Actinomycetota bacterium]|nr:putative hydrolase [Actinomycetota bacterium]